MYYAGGRFAARFVNARCRLARSRQQKAVLRCPGRYLRVTIPMNSRPSSIGERPWMGSRNCRMDLRFASALTCIAGWDTLRQKRTLPGSPAFSAGGSKANALTRPSDALTTKHLRGVPFKAVFVGLFRGVRGGTNFLSVELADQALRQTLFRSIP